VVRVIVMDAHRSRGGLRDSTNPRVLFELGATGGVRVPRIG